MEVVVTKGAISRAKLQSNHHHQQTNTHFFTGQMPFLLPNQQCQSTEGKYHSPWTYLPQAHLTVFQLCLWPVTSPGYLGEVCHTSHQPSGASIPTLGLPDWCKWFAQVWQYLRLPLPSPPWFGVSAFWHLHTLAALTCVAEATPKAAMPLLLQDSKCRQKRWSPSVHFCWLASQGHPACY